MGEAVAAVRISGRVQIHFPRCQRVGNSGTLAVLRHGIRDLGVTFRLAYFKPASKLARGAVVAFGKNRLSVTRQVRYSTSHANEIDVVLFVNGIPVATAELKNPLSGQSVQNGIKQYRKDRDPRDLLLSFKKRCLVHFAVDPDEVYMTTRLAGKQHRLPALQPAGQRHARRQPANPAATRPPTSGKRSGRATAAGHPRALHPPADQGRSSDGKQVGRDDDLPALPPARLRAEVSRPTAGTTGAGTQLPHPALGRVGQEQLHRLARPPASPACTTADDQTGLRLGHRGHRPAGARQAAPGHDLPVRAQAGRGPADRRELAQLAEALTAGTPIIITTLQKFPFVTRRRYRRPAGAQLRVIVDEAHSSQSGEAPASVLARAHWGRRAGEEASRGGRTDYEEESSRPMAARGTAEEPELLRLHRHPKAQDPRDLRHQD